MSCLIYDQKENWEGNENGWCVLTSATLPAGLECRGICNTAAARTALCNVLPKQHTNKLPRCHKKGTEATLLRTLAKRDTTSNYFFQSWKHHKKLCKVVMRVLGKVNVVATVLVIVIYFYSGSATFNRSLHKTSYYHTMIRFEPKI